MNVLLCKSQLGAKKWSLKTWFSQKIRVTKSVPHSRSAVHFVIWSWSSRVWVGLCPLDTTKVSFSRKTRFWGCFLVLKAPTNLKLWVFDTVQTKPRMNIRYTDSHRFANIPMWLTESFSRVTKCNQTGKASFSLKKKQRFWGRFLVLKPTKTVSTPHHTDWN